ncbi:MAG TPA: hypothetical protein VG963_28950 [Polyangiaceae bacterium]|nr:hypothetical protein [Polyangiaceae bacterium]
MRDVVLVSSLFLALACGGAHKPTAHAARPLTPEQLKAFDEGVDFVATLEGLEGRWRADWDRDLELRVSSADRIALVTVRTLLTDTDPEQRVTYRLMAQIDRDLMGDEKSKEVELPVSGDDPGFTSVQDNLGRIPDQHFIAYIRREPTGTRWHLSPASDPVVTETQGKISELARIPNQSSSERVIVHNH